MKSDAFQYQSDQSAAIGNASGMLMKIMHTNMASRPNRSSRIMRPTLRTRVKSAEIYRFEEDQPAEAGAFESGLAGAPNVSAIVAMSEEDMAKPHDEQNLLVSGTSLKHDGQRIDEPSK